MTLQQSTIAAVLASSCVLGALSLRPDASPAASSQPSDRLALLQLAEDFHAAGTYGDQGLLESIFTEDSSFSNPSMTITGKANVLAFFMSAPTWGVAASLTPTYKTNIDVQGTTATVHFECIIVHTGGGDPATTTLSTLPFGSQNPAVAIVQHSNALVTAVKRGGVWRIQHFQGGAGPILQ